MGKIYFRYGTMGSAKTANALMTYYNFKEENRKKVLLLKPSIDNRDGVAIIKSRIGLEAYAEIINPTDLILNKINLDNVPEWIIIDEVQFLSSIQIEELCVLADEHNVNILAYGLKSDFKGNLFDGSKKLIEMADKIEEIKSQCHCGKKAIMNARIINGKVVTEGEQILIGGNDSYVMLCRSCWKKGLVQSK